MFDAPHVYVYAAYVCLTIIPLVLSIFAKPGSDLELLLEALASWGFDARKFFDRLGKFLSSKGPPSPPASPGVLVVVGALVTAPVAVGCAWLKGAEPVIVTAEQDECLILPLLLPSGAQICAVEDEVLKILHILLSAQAAHAAATFDVKHKDGSVSHEHIDAADVPAAVAKLYGHLGKLGAARGAR